MKTINFEAVRYKILIVTIATMSSWFAQAQSEDIPKNCTDFRSNGEGISCYLQSSNPPGLVSSITKSICDDPKFSGPGNICIRSDETRIFDTKDKMALLNSFTMDNRSTVIIRNTTGINKWALNARRANFFGSSRIVGKGIDAEQASRNATDMGRNRQCLAGDTGRNGPGGGNGGNGIDVTLEVALDQVNYVEIDLRGGNGGDGGKGSTGQAGGDASCENGSFCDGREGGGGGRGGPGGIAGNGGHLVVNWTNYPGGPVMRHPVDDRTSGPYGITPIIDPAHGGAGGKEGDGGDSGGGKTCRTGQRQGQGGPPAAGLGLGADHSKQLGKPPSYEFHQG